MGSLWHANTILYVKKSLYSREQVILQNLLRQARVDAGLLQEELAQRLETYKTFVSKYESGERILDLHELRQVCMVLGLSLIDFIRMYEDKINKNQW